MSLLQPALSHVAPFEPFSSPRQRPVPPLRAAVVRQCLALGALGYCLIGGAGCSFDSRPNKAGVHSSATSDPAWMPPAAARGDAATNADPDGATTEPARQPRAADAGTRDTAQTGTPDAGRARRAHAMDAMNATDAMDASVPAQRSATDAGARDTSARDAQAPRPKPDAAQLDGASSNQTAAERCKPGAYTGTFSGSIQLVGLSLSSVTGTVRAELTRDAAGEYLELNNGRVVGVDQDGNRLTCNLSGSVNCMTDELEDGKLENGNFHNVGSDSDTAFIGSAQATYSRDPHSLIGTFSVEAKESSIFGGRGTWSLVRDN